MGAGKGRKTGNTEAPAGDLHLLAFRCIPLSAWSNKSSGFASGHHLKFVPECFSVTVSWIGGLSTCKFWGTPIELPPCICTMWKPGTNGIKSIAGTVKQKEKKKTVWFINSNGNVMSLGEHVFCIQGPWTSILSSLWIHLSFWKWPYSL